MLVYPAALIVLVTTSSWARPAGRLGGVLSSSAAYIHSVARQLPAGRYVLPDSDNQEIRRLAKVVNDVYESDGVDHRPLRVQAASRPTADKHIIATSSRASATHMSWQITQTSADTITLAFSSPPIRDVLELFAEPSLNDTTSPLAALPDYLFPVLSMPNPSPLVHRSFLGPLEEFGAPALLALIDHIGSQRRDQAQSQTETLFKCIKPSTSAALSLLDPLGIEDQEETRPAVKMISLGSLFRSQPSRVPAGIQKVEVIGHGLGAAIALLVALALHCEVTGPAAQTYSAPLSSLDIRFTGFSTPRIGDETFAAWIEALVSDSPSMSITRINAAGDPLPLLPGTHMGLTHVGQEIWLVPETSDATLCVAENGKRESSKCSAGQELGQMSLRNHAGPYGGAWLGEGV